MDALGVPRRRIRICRYGIWHYRINCPLLKVLTGKELTDAEAKALLQKYGFKTE